MTDHFAGGVIRWEDPPPVRAGDNSRPTQRSWAVVAAQLQERPGEWALIATEIHSHTLVRIRRGAGWWAPAGSFEAVERTIDGARYAWARYVGDR